MNNMKYWVWLSMIFGTGSRRIWEAMRLFENAEEAYEEISSGSLNDRLDDKELRNVKNIGINKAVEHIEYCQKLGISIAGYGDAEYPPQLRHILNPPAVLYYKGNISCLKMKRTVVSVGARKAGDYSIYACNRICQDLAKCGVIIVSGFALGIDITSHLAAVSMNRPTACVLGCGVDVDYPKDNFRYREAILANGGVFVSEFPPGTPPHSQNFPKRNRILAALGKVTVVFEASMKSGSLITASLALENGREVFCLPPADIFTRSFSGNIAFLRDGASPLYSAADIMNCFRIGGANESEILSEAYSNPGDISGFGIGELEPKRKRFDGSKKSVHKNTSEKQRKSDVINNQESSAVEIEEKAPKNIKNGEFYDSLSDIQKKIVDLISGKTVHADIIAQQLEIDPSEVTVELTELEILGVIKALPGKMFEIA